MEGIELRIDGYFHMTIYYMNGSVVGEHKDKDILAGIFDNLQMGEYLIGIESRTIKDINDLNTVLYTFDIVPTNDVEYDFDSL